MVEWVPYIAMVGSFSGLFGVMRKRYWGPVVCGVSSGVWAGVAFSTSQVPWGLVETLYSIVNFGIAVKWLQEN